MAIRVALVAGNTRFLGMKSLLAARQLSQDAVRWAEEIPTTRSLDDEIVLVAPYLVLSAAVDVKDFVTRFSVSPDVGDCL
jgi:hypothetical protein